MGHNVEDYVVGKGILSIAEFSGGTPGGYVDVGNCPTFELEPGIKRLDHFSSRGGLKVKDKNPITESVYTAKFDLDEVSAVNLNHFLMGTLSGNTIKGLQGANNEFAIRFVSDNPIGPNYTVDLWKCTLGPSGALKFIGDDWLNMSFAAEGLADVVNHADSPYYTVVMETTTTTTSTTTTS